MKRQVEPRHSASSAGMAGRQWWPPCKFQEVLLSITGWCIGLCRLVPKEVLLGETRGTGILPAWQIWLLPAAGADLTQMEIDLNNRIDDISIALTSIRIHLARNKASADASGLA